MPEDPTYQTLDSKLYIEGVGLIEFNFGFFSDIKKPRMEVKVWNIKRQGYLWKGTPTEFWALILAGIEATKPKPCPKCGQMEGHQELCPIKLLAKKEG